MRFRRLRLQHFRAIEACDIELLPSDATTGITIVEGPNETGKTSLVEAIRLLWTYPHSSRHRDVRDIQPIGRDVGTRIALELDAPGLSMSYSKTFNRDAGAELTVRGERTAHLTGKEAHARATTLLEGMVDTSLWHALQVSQGIVAQAPLGDAHALARALLRDGGAVPDADPAGADSGGHAGGFAGIIDDRDLVIADRIERERARWRTDAGRDRRELADLAARVERLRAERDEAQAVLDEVAADLRHIDRLRTCIPQQRAAITASSRELAALEEQLAGLDHLEHRMAEVNRAVEHAAVLRNHARAASEARQHVVADHARAVRELTEARDQAPGGPDSDEPRVAIERATTNLVALEDRLAVLRAAADTARLRFEERRDARELAVLLGRQRRLRELEGRMAAAERVIAESRIDETRMAELHAAERAVLQTRAALSVAAPTVQVVAVADTVVGIAEGPSEPLAAGAEVVIVAEDAVSLRIGEIATVGVRPGGEPSLTTAANDAQAQRKRLLDSIGVATTDDAVARLDAVRAARQEHAAVLAERDGMGEGDAQNVAVQIAAVEQRMSGRAAEGGHQATADPHASPGPDGLLGPEGLPGPDGPGRDAPPGRDATSSRDGRDGVDAARAAYEEAEAALRETELRLAQQRIAVEAARTAMESERGSAERARIAVQVAEKALAQVEGRLVRMRALHDDASLAEAEASCERELQDARAERAFLRRQLDAADAENLRELQHSLRLAVDSGTQRIQAEERSLAGLEAVVAARSADGPRTRRDALQTKLDQAVADLERSRARADAAELAERIFERHRAEQRRRYQAPLRDRIERLGRLLWGSTFGVELDDDLRIRTRILDGRALDYDQLSLGAQEQLALIGRLACAIVVGPGGAPLIIDDALGFSDPDKLRRMGAVLTVAGRSCQIVLLTCHPQRYLHVTGARRVHMRSPSTHTDATAAA